MQKFLRTTSIIVMAVLPVTISFAQTSTTSLPGLFACMPIEDDLDRVKCYDKIADELQAADRKGEVVTITKKQVEEMEKESFGFNLPSIPKLSSLFGISSKNTKEASANKKGHKSVTLLITKTKKFGYKKTMFYFNNGQVWKQTDNKSIRISKKNPPQTAVIKKGALGSYLLTVDGRGAAYNVVRVK